MSNQKLTYLTKIYKGGGFDCTCPQGFYSPDKFCKHASKLWMSLTPFQRQIVNQRKMNKRIMVNTPKGTKFHGEVREHMGKPVFFRIVDPEKDRMKIFDAYSIHPDAFKQLRKLNIEKMIYLAGKKKLEIGVPELADMLDGKILDGKTKLAWTAEFAGGETIYIKVNAFNKEYVDNNQTLNI